MRRREGKGDPPGTEHDTSTSSRETTSEAKGKGLGEWKEKVDEEREQARPSGWRSAWRPSSSSPSSSASASSPSASVDEEGKKTKNALNSLPRNRINSQSLEMLEVLKRGRTVCLQEEIHLPFNEQAELAVRECHMLTTVKR